MKETILKLTFCRILKKHQIIKISSADIGIIPGLKNLNLGECKFCGMKGYYIINKKILDKRNIM